MGLLNWLRGEGSPTGRVTMIASVDDLVAGESYDLPTLLADSLIVKGYADGKLSQPYSASQVEAIRGKTQVIAFDG